MNDHDPLAEIRECLTRDGMEGYPTIHDMARAFVESCDLQTDLVKARIKGIPESVESFDVEDSEVQTLIDICLMTASCMFRALNAKYAMTEDEMTQVFLKRCIPLWDISAVCKKVEKEKTLFKPFPEASNPETVIELLVRELLALDEENPVPESIVH